MPGVHIGVTAAFIGVTLAITAFPMLARIIIERGLSGTRFGSLALACGGIDDMAAWILLAGVLSLASAKLWPVTKALGGAVVFAAILILVIRPLLERYLRRPGLSPQTVLLITMVLVLAAAWFTTDIGLYARLRRVLDRPGDAPGAPGAWEQDPANSDQVRAGADLVTPTMGGFSRTLVPMFFTYSGLNTRFALLTNPRVLLFSVAAIVVAVLSKGGACWLGARLAGERGLVPARVAHADERARAHAAHRAERRPAGGHRQRGPVHQPGLGRAGHDDHDRARPELD